MTASYPGHGRDTGGQCPLTSGARGLCPCCHSPSLNLGDLQDTAQVSLPGASALSTNFFPFPCFLKRFLCCNSHPCPAWGHSRGRRAQPRSGPGDTRFGGHGWLSASSPQGLPPFPGARGVSLCPALPPPVSQQGPDTALPVSPGSRDTVGTGQAGIYSENFSRHAVLTAQPQIPPVPSAKSGGGTKE